VCFGPFKRVLCHGHQQSFRGSEVIALPDIETDGASGVFAFFIVLENAQRCFNGIRGFFLVLIAYNRPGINTIQRCVRLDRTVSGRRI